MIKIFTRFSSYVGDIDFIKEEKMIYVMGDAHGDRSRLKKKNLKGIKKGDYLVICGDFGFIWKGDKREWRYLKRLGKRKYGILFVDGAHENFNELMKYPVEEWNGGKIRRISGNLMYLMRGEIFNLDDKTIFSFGGGQLEESDLTMEEYECSDVPELPSEEDFIKAVSKLKQTGYVDFIFSYEAPRRIAEFLSLAKTKSFNSSHLNTFLDIINESCEFNKWFFGQYHKNKTVSSKYYAVYNKIIKAE